ncbi:MAG: tetratricopeptide repeat protein [Planctomycetota bacterium]
MSRPAEWRWTALAVAVVLLAATLPFLGCLGHSFLCWDDGIIILGQPFLRALTPQNLWTILCPFPPREEWLPLRDLSLALNFALFGAAPWSFALVNVLLHAAAAVASFFLFRALTGRRDAALAGALLFACHAIHVESVAWLSGRKDPLHALLLILALLAWVRFRDGRRGAWWLALGLFLLALLSKASAIVFGPWLVAYDLFCLKEPRLGERPWRARILPLVPFALLGALHMVLYVRSTSADGVIEPYPAGGLPTVLRTDLVVLTGYLRRLVWPREHQTIYEVTFRQALDPTVVTSAALLLGLATLLWRTRRRWPLASFAGAAGALSLLPYMNLIPHGIYLAERYLYLPSLFLALVAGQAWDGLRRRAGRDSGRVLLVALALWVGAHAALSAARSRVWRDDETFWRYQASQLPGSPTPLMNLAEAHETHQRWPEAAALYAELAAREPVVPLAVFRLARVERQLGRLTDAERDYRRYLRLAPDDPQGPNNLGEVLLRAGRPAEALAVWRAAAARFPDSLRTQRTLALALESTGARAEARPHWEAVVRLARTVPDQPLAREARAHLARP